MSRIKSRKYMGVYINILQNGDESYSVTFKDENNRMKRRSIGKKSEGITQLYAFNKRSEYINNIRHGEDPQADRKKKEVITLDRLADVYFEDRESNKTNERQEGKYKLHVKNVLGNKSISKIEKGDIVSLRKKLEKKKLAPKTTNGIIQLITAIINNSIKEHELKIANPTIGIKKLKVDDKRERFLSLEEIQRLKKKVGGNDIVSFFVRLALTTGARLETLLHIQKKDINLDNNQVTLKDLKSDKTYTGYFGNDLKEDLRKIISKLTINDYLIGGKAEQLPGRTMRRWLKPTLDELFNVGLEVNDAKNRVVIHTLRHTFASQLAIKGVPIFTIQKLMNHAKIDMTMRYAKLSPDAGKDAVRELFDV